MNISVLYHSLNKGRLVVPEDILLGPIVGLTGDPENIGFAVETAILAAQQDYI